MEREPFEGILGKSINVRFLDFLIAHPFDSYSVKELSEFSEISRTAIYEILPEFLRFGILKEVRKIGGIKMYQTNLESEVIKAILRLNMALVNAIAKETIQAEGEKYPEPQPYIQKLPDGVITFDYKDSKREKPKLYNDLITV